MVSKGSILISEPFLGDNNFERTVILLCDHTEQGTFGFVLNRESSVQANTVIEGIPNYVTNLYVGGPVSQNTVHFLHRSTNRLEGDIEIVKNLFWGGNFDDLKFNLQSGIILPDDVRFFVGYSGWGAGQLDKEISNKSWITGEVSVGEVFETEASTFWRNILKNKGGKYKIIANYPIDPRLN